jgi:hypothetical protein
MRSKQSSELHGTGGYEIGALHQCLEGPASGSPAGPLAYFPMPVQLLSRAVHASQERSGSDGRTAR